MLESKCIIFSHSATATKVYPAAPTGKPRAILDLSIFLHIQALLLIPSLKYLSHLLLCSQNHQPGLSPQHAPGMPLFPPLPAPTLLKSIFQSSQKDPQKQRSDHVLPF